MYRIYRNKKVIGREKVLYLHIPKCAGSSVNALFDHNYGKGKTLEHIESSLFREDGSMHELDDKYKYISGHVTYPKLKQNIDLSNLSNGIYYLEIIDGYNRIRKKIIKY